jgi:hypothetical protein
VIEVTRGFKGFREINTVIFDPMQITPEEMTAALESSGTYLGPAED